MEILSPTCIIDADCSLVAFDEGSRVRAPDPKNVRFLVVTSQHGKHRAPRLGFAWPRCLEKVANIFSQMVVQMVMNPMVQSKKITLSKSKDSEDKTTRKMGQVQKPADKCQKYTFFWWFTLLKLTTSPLKISRNCAVKKRIVGVYGILKLHP